MTVWVLVVAIHSSGESTRLVTLDYLLWWLVMVGLVASVELTGRFKCAL